MAKALALESMRTAKLKSVAAMSLLLPALKTCAFVFATPLACPSSAATCFYRRVLLADHKSVVHASYLSTSETVILSDSHKPAASEWTAWIERIRLKKVDQVMTLRPRCHPVFVSGVHL